MKKFTTLEEDLLKENAQIQAKFEAEMNFALDSLNKIKIALNNMDKEFYTKANLEFVDVLQHVNDLLIDVIDHIPSEPFK